MSVEIEKSVPVVEDGIKYWTSQPASDDGVLGGYGTGSLPRVESLGSRQFILYIRPDLCIVPSALRPLNIIPPPRRTRALDVGAGVGRVTSDTLLHLVSDVVLVEPVESLLQEAIARGQASSSTTQSSGVEPRSRQWKGIADASKSVTFLQDTLQSINPRRPTDSSTYIGRVGYTPEPSDDDLNSGFDIIWCQWCLMYMSDTDLVAFFRRGQAALRELDKSVIVVKENVSQDGLDEDGCLSPSVTFDKDDSSVTRSDQAWKGLFKEGGLTLVHEQVQNGLPEGLYAVKM
ncbi:methyltransferase domain-containing protein [Amylostereum chailletii]|nr:methyltransferase domain-containing protein [Amylostereum chailletii]